ncbi:MAG: ABC transporter substrate-binding protein [Polaromonas sp.]|uniref:ABC transporter substrate-binding protein n=1 Tax=Polaromonas sp. TaxID=1869339 RepID=UPI0025D958E3|nr:ABC transporter substrate-binding protein [Polaromonas sp.]MBI2726312.1 ABC transporter substrate-binding protein [Polaromonas sp.]
MPISALLTGLTNPIEIECMEGISQADGMPKIRVGIVSKTYYYTPLWIAQDCHFFKDEGIQVEIELLGNQNPAELLYRHEIQLAIAPPDSVLQDVDKGGRLRLLAGNSDRLSHCLITQPEITTVEQLKGKRFGILSRTEGSFFHFRALAKAHGLVYPGDYELVETGGAPVRHQMLLDRKIDAGLQSFPWVYVAEKLSFNNIADISDYLPQWQFNTLNAHLDWVEENRELVTRFLRAMIRATNWFYENREGAAEVAARNLGINITDSQAGWDYFAKTECITPDMSLSLEGLSHVYAALIDANLIKHPNALVNRAYDATSILDEVLRQIRWESGFKGSLEKVQ